MKKLLPLVLVLTLTTPSWSQTRPVEDIPPGQDQIQYLPKGTPAPYSGQLFDDQTALRWANWIRQYKAFYQMDMESQQKQCAVSVQLEQRKLQLTEEHYKQIVLEYDTRLKEAGRPQTTPFYSTMEFGVAVGAVGAFTSVILTAWVLNEIK